ncbi:MAG: glycosyltransferase family 4 protein [Planctomycetes bacterium]|nr:glycosyltransferase family 4 protein [Planctomycetota bacterium]
MKIAYITAGAAGMYCGSCMRDNLLVGALRSLGVEALLIPTYTPIRTDGEDLSEKRLFLGGINVYLGHKLPFWRKLPRFLTRPLSAPALLRAAGRFAVRNRPQELGELALSMLRGGAGAHASEIEDLADWLARTARPDLLHLTNSLFAGLAPLLKQRLGVPVLCTLQGEDLFLEGLPEPIRGRARALIGEQAASIDGFIAVSAYYRQFMSRHLGIPLEKIHAVPPGVRVQDFSPARERRLRRQAEIPGSPVVIGYLARICREKGAGLLLEAFARLKKLPGAEAARLRLAGYLGPADRRWLAGLLKNGPAAALAGDIEVLGTLSWPEKLEFLSSLDLFSVPAVYREPKGLYVFEALSCGLPVVLPEHGAFPEIVQATGGGVLVAPESPAALAEGIQRLAVDAGKRAELGQRGAEAVHRRFTDRRMAEVTLEVYRQYIS